MGCGSIPMTTAQMETIMLAALSRRLPRCPVCRQPYDPREDAGFLLQDRCDTCELIQIDQWLHRLIDAPTRRQRRQVLTNLWRRAEQVRLGGRSARR